MHEMRLAATDPATEAAGVTRGRGRVTFRSSTPHILCGQPTKGKRIISEREDAGHDDDDAM